MTRRIELPFARCQWYPLTSLRVFIDEEFEKNKSNSKIAKRDYKIIHEELLPFLIYAESQKFNIDFRINQFGDPADISYRQSENVADTKGIQVTCAFPDWDTACRPEKSEQERKNPGFIAHLEREELERRGIVFRGSEISKGDDTNPSSISGYEYIIAWSSGVKNSIIKKSKNMQYADKDLALLIAADGIKFDLIYENTQSFLDSVSLLISEELNGSCFSSIHIIDISRYDTVWKVR